MSDNTKNGRVPDYRSAKFTRLECLGLSLIPPKQGGPLPLRESKNVGRIVSNPKICELVSGKLSQHLITSSYWLNGCVFWSITFKTTDPQNVTDNT